MATNDKGSVLRLSSTTSTEYLEMTRNNRSGRDLVHRWEGNPLISLPDLDFRCSDIRAAGVATVGSGLILLVTIDHLEGHQSIHLARPSDKWGYEVERDPFLAACRQEEGCSLHESHGVMDARVTFMDDKYYIVYVASGEHGLRLGLASTTDFTNVVRHGLISEPDTKGGALFPEKINGRYARLERPAAGGSIWLSYSNDLTYWGDSRPLLGPRAGFWDSSRVGTGPPPLRIPEGWLLIYYGVKMTSAGPLYRLGAAILDEKNPGKVVERSNIPILASRERYERIGDLSNIVFCTGAIIDENNSIQLFYTGADSCLCRGTVDIEDIVDTCSRSVEEF